MNNISKQSLAITKFNLFIHEVADNCRNNQVVIISFQFYKKCSYDFAAKRDSL